MKCFQCKERIKIHVTTIEEVNHNFCNCRCALEWLKSCIFIPPYKIVINGKEIK